MSGYRHQTSLETFLATNRGRLAAAVGGAAVIGMLLTTPAPADPASTIVSAAISDSRPIFVDATGTGSVDWISGGHPIAGKWMESEKLAAVLAAVSTEETMEASAAAVEAIGNLDEIREAIGDKRARLENAMRELENLELMVESAQTLNPSERGEAVSAALLIYNESVAGAEFVVEADNDDERASPTFDKADGAATPLLLAISPMQ